jgi:DNA polymerase III sliding clamp (beta) subunit (PCNA family)
MTTTTDERTTTTLEGTVAASSLLRAIGAVKPLAKPTYRKGKTTLPPRIRLDWTDDAVTVSATDGEAWASYRIDSAVCTGPGTVIIQASLLAAVAKTTGKVAITASSDDQVRFTSVAGTTLLRHSPDAEWPATPDVPTDTAWPVDPAHVRAVLPAASTEDARPILEAVAFQLGAIVATDSYRLHYIDGDLPDYPDLLIPGHALRWVAKETEPVSISATTEVRPVVRISGGAQTWTVKTTDGGWHKQADTGERVQDRAEYVNWRKLPEMHPATSHLIIDRAEILRAIRHCMSISTPSSWTPIPVIMAMSATSVQFTRNVPDVCALETSAVAKLDGQEMTIAFGGRYLRDCIAAGSGDTVTIGFSDPITAALVTDNGPCVRLLMPVRVR